MFSDTSTKNLLPDKTFLLKSIGLQCIDGVELGHFQAFLFNLFFSKVFIYMHVVNRLQINHWKGDLSAGLTAAMATVPLAMLLGEASGLGALAGFYGAIIVGLLSALLGGVATRISAPTVSIMMVVLLISSYFSTQPSLPVSVISLVFATVVISGLLQIVLGAFHLGRFIACVPHPVISGFMSAVGLTVILTQLGPLFGLPAAIMPVEALFEFNITLTSSHQDTLLLGVIVLLIVFVLPLVLPRLHQLVPAPLIALLVGAVLGETLFNQSRLQLLGEIPSALPELVLSTDFAVLGWPTWLAVLGFAIVLALVSSFNSLLSARVADQITKTKHNAQRELIAQGVANSVAGLFSAMPAAAATMRTVASIKAGGKTPLAGVIYALALLSIVLLFSDQVARLPSVVLAAILIKLGFDVVDWELLKNIRAMTTQGVILMTMVVIIAVMLNPLLAVVIAMCVSVFMSLRTQGRKQTATMVINNQPVAELNLSAEEQQAFEAIDGRAVLLSFSSELSFVAVYEMEKQLASFSDYDVLVFDLTKVPTIDFTVTKVFDQLIEKTIENGHEVMLVGVRSQLGNILKQHRVMDRVHSDFMFVKLIGALREAKSYIQKKITV